MDVGILASFLSDTGRHDQAALIYKKLTTERPYDREYYQLWVDNLLLQKKRGRSHWRI